MRKYLWLWAQLEDELSESNPSSDEVAGGEGGGDIGAGAEKTKPVWEEEDEEDAERERERRGAVMFVVGIVLQSSVKSFVKYLSTRV